MEPAILDVLSEKKNPALNDNSNSDNVRVKIGGQKQSAKQQPEPTESPTDKAATDGQGNWAEPIPLQPEIPLQKTFPTDALGETLSKVVKGIAERVQVPETIAAQSVLAVCSLAVQGHEDVKVRHITTPVSLFIMTVADSGDRKSTSDNLAMQGVKRYEKELVELYAEEYKNHLINARAYKETLNKLTRKYNKDNNKMDMEGFQQFLSEIPVPIPPMRPNFLMSEPTMAGLLKFFQYGQPSAGLFSDEGAQLVGGHAMNKDNFLDTSGKLCKFFDGSSVDRVRGEDGSTTLFGRRLSLHLMFQPKVFQELFSNPLLRDQGIINRNLFSMPESLAGQRIISAEVENRDYSEIYQFHDKIYQIMNTELNIAEEKRELGILEFNLIDINQNPEALKLWENFYDKIELQMKKNGDYRDIRGYASRIAEQAQRIAGVLTAYENLDASTVKTITMQGAIEIAQFYLDEFLRLTEIGEEDAQLSQTQKMLDWFKLKWKQKYISIPDMCQHGPRSLRKRDTVLEIVLVLLNHKYLLDAGKQTIDGKVRIQSYEIL